MPLKQEKKVRWVDEANPNREKRLLSEIEIVKHELRELKMMLKILDKGQSILAMLEIGSKLSSASNEKLSDSSDPSGCHFLKSLSSLSSWSLSSSSAFPKFSSTSLSNTSTSPIYVTSQPNPVTICGKWPSLVFFTRRMPSKPRKLKQLHSIFHS
ncbi:hypothetical protein Cgig2_005873 [Carnegiea gigantea]|uniref:Uncharacterized protein n=1 Tax=Carnegiea gigantea TaxID=171969 RepID=A0A9Q1KPI0_9CARY|nr:hypothetical protein Cgig2_005873 [Carnegiea gigantea]